MKSSKRRNPKKKKISRREKRVRSNASFDRCVKALEHMFRGFFLPGRKRLYSIGVESEMLVIVLCGDADMSGNTSSLCLPIEFIEFFRELLSLQMLCFLYYNISRLFNTTKLKFPVWSFYENQSQCRP